MVMGVIVVKRLHLLVYQTHAATWTLCRKLVHRRKQQQQQDKIKAPTVPLLLLVGATEMILLVGDGLIVV